MVLRVPEATGDSWLSFTKVLQCWRSAQHPTVFSDGQRCPVVLLHIALVLGTEVRFPAYKIYTLTPSCLPDSQDLKLQEMPMGPGPCGIAFPHVLCLLTPIHSLSLCVDSVLGLGRTRRQVCGGYVLTVCRLGLGCLAFLGWVSFSVFSPTWDTVLMLPRFYLLSAILAY